MFYNCVGAEILRIGRICSNDLNFVNAGNLAIDRAIKQGARVDRLGKVLTSSIEMLS